MPRPYACSCRRVEKTAREAGGRKILAKDWNEKPALLRLRVDIFESIMPNFSVGSMFMFKFKVQARDITGSRFKVYISFTASSLFAFHLPPQFNLRISYITTRRLLTLENGHHSFQCIAIVSYSTRMRPNIKVFS